MKRPLGVWLVTVYAVLNVLVTAAGLYILVSGGLSEQSGLLSNFDSTDYAISLVSHVFIALGGISIFMLRKIALPMFLAGAVFNLVQTVLHVVTQRFMAGVGGPSLLAWIELLLAWAIILAVIAYTARLSRDGVLS
jgi:hypothetical protein